MKTNRLFCVLAALCVTAASAGCAGSQPESQKPSLPPESSLSAVSDSSGTSSATEGELVPKINKSPRSRSENALEEGLAFAAADSAKSADGDINTAVPEKPAPEPAASAVTPASDPTLSGEVEEPVSLPSDEVLPPEPEIPPQVGLLTAGEWNDNRNWGFFTNLLNTGTIELPRQYGVVPNNRTAVTVKDSSGRALSNAAVNLLDEEGKVLWSGVSDHEGNAYLFAPDGVKPTAVEVTMGEITHKQELVLKEAGQQTEINTQNNTVEVVLGAENKTFPKTEIMFVVDTTGSMGDELMFLQTEFTAIAEAAGSGDTRYSINFYRDEGDEYTTKRYPFSSDIPEIQKKLNSESAEGGGDLPEAVAEILDETIRDGGWSQDSVKLMFLIFDAPPHDDKQQVLEQAVRKAAQQGIRIIPVVSSNSDRDTELFGRCLAIATGGTYVFLTDDSGVGDSHLEPIIGSYQTEKLYDVILRVIETYRQPSSGT